MPHLQPAVVKIRGLHVVSCDERSRKIYCNNGPCRVSIDRNLSIFVYKPVEFQTGLSDLIDKNPLIYSVPKTTSLIVIGVRDECLAC